MTGKISYLSDFEEINGGYVAFGRSPKGGKITRKDTECIVLSSDFKLPDDNHVLLRVPRENDMYNVDLKNIVPLGDLTCLFAKATLDENKARLVSQGHTQEEGIDYEEVFAPAVRIEAIRAIEEEAYVCQSPRFEDSNYPDKVYVDDIIFGSTNKDMCKAFEKLMKDKFQMSSMAELTFFLGLQVKQKKVGLFISHDKYVAEILRKFGLTIGKSASTPIDTENPLLKDPVGEDVDVHTY
nr:hypothetical protein [Tanacetum cinerariifolium]